MPIKTLPDAVDEAVDAMESADKRRLRREMGIRSIGASEESVVGGAPRIKRQTSPNQLEESNEDNVSEEEGGARDAKPAEFDGQ